MGEGFIDRVEVGNPAVTYKVTDRGLQLLNSINSIVEMLGLDNEDSS